ncbi:hypothetical protein MNEG_16522, partial [Monoraphidium neglectum]
MVPAASAAQSDVPSTLPPVLAAPALDASGGAAPVEIRRQQDQRLGRDNIDAPATGISAAAKALAPVSAAPAPDLAGPAPQPAAEPARAVAASAAPMLTRKPKKAKPSGPGPLGWA